MNELVRLTTLDVSSAMPITDSRIIANEFGKEHYNVIRDIEELLASEAIRDDLKFEVIYYVKESTYIDSLNRTKKCYEMNEAFTMLLVMGYNTEKALAIKTQFIKAFLLMKNELLARKETRHIGKFVRRSLTDSIRDSVNEGTFKNYAYSNYSKLIYKKVLGMQVKKAKELRGLKESDNIRDFLTIEELEKVQAMESKVANFIELTDTMGKSDKEMYTLIKAHLEK